MKPCYSRVVGCVCLLAASAAMITGCGDGPASGEKTAPAAAPPPGEAAPVTADGLASLLAASKGKVTVVNFWAIWCPPCVAELPELAKFYSEHSGDSVAFHAISLDGVEGIETVITPFLKAKTVPFPVHVLADRDIEAVSKAVNAEISGALPATLIYNRQGDLVKSWEGGITLEELNQIVKPLL
ncbi:MAG: Sporulation thiol-disulfide oxidoreductase A precursor [Candidatus Hydrogenedentes bacterium ADurb.Bin101]|nr:MAG: Sporulation thiol-disulfide oxidoreductase A precursor [Candidatus Hydrogenedentes bacterium ADurb.Bin101]HOC70057.1 TlpA disulfide reductase family protein [Candidatus Hydrogenedentota bacterium]